MFTLGDLVKGLRRTARELEAMARDGVVLGLMGNDALIHEGHQHYRPLTTDLEVARRYGFDGLPDAEKSRVKAEMNKPADVIVLPLGRRSRPAQVAKTAH